jgi:phage baseplate assembly protein W
MAERFINIKFPFDDDPKGKFLEMTQTNEEAIKSDLLHLLLTTRRERLYLPSFGTNLRQYIFEQNDGVVHEGVKKELQQAINRFIPGLQVNEITVTKSESNEHAAIARLDYTVTRAAFVSSDFVEIEI